MYNTCQVIDDIMLVIVGLNYRTPENGIERRIPKVNTSTGIGTYIIKVLSIQKIMRRLGPVCEFERKIITFLELIKVVNST